MGIAYEAATRLFVPGESPAVVEATVSPVGGQWEAVVRIRHAAQAWTLLARRFRARDQGEALGKMIRWVRGRFPP